MNGSTDNKNTSLTVDELLVEFPKLRDEVSGLKKEIDDMKVNYQFLSDPFLETHRVCEFLSMSYRQLKYYVQSGELEPYYNGRRILFRASELRRFAEEVLKVKGRKRNERNL